jgi:hypothetical protein
MREITNERLEKYLNLTKKALELAKPAHSSAQATELWDMANRYYQDALHFQKQGNVVNAFACVNYAHGWLDAGARLGLFKVTDSNLFAVD